VASKSIRESLQQAKQSLVSRVDMPALEAEILLAHVLGQSRAYLYAWPDRQLTVQEAEVYHACLARRIQGEPVAYIIGIKEFWSMPFIVTPDTLIPRADTEILVETILDRFSDQQPITLVDLGTGSGAIAIAIAHERPHWQVHASDSDANTLAVAKANAHALGVSPISFHLGDWLSAVPALTFNIIVSNPPYISEHEWMSVKDDLACEPRSALVAGKNGLADIEAVMAAAPHYLKPGGTLFFEHGYQQAEEVRRLFAYYEYIHIETVRDLAFHERVTLGTRKLV